MKGEKKNVTAIPFEVVILAFSNRRRRVPALLGNDGIK